MLHNPILKGFHPDPCICRKGDDYYLAVSSFEWMPGIPIYHSKDLKNWELYSHVLTNDNNPCLRNLPSAKGIWAPCLTYCRSEDLFYVIYGVMNNMNARYFDCSNYLITAKDPKGPWSEPVFLHSAGFDASILHDDDGRKYIVSLEWETRKGYEEPGVICMAEYSPSEKRIIGYPRRIWRGGTDRGCIEAPHLTKRGGYYYIMCAEGGTGYNHCVTMGRSKQVWGPYESDPCNPIVTAQPKISNERQDPDANKPQYYNPASLLQKCGHGSYTETQKGEVYLFHLCSRPFVPDLRCTLGRETAIEKMTWTEDGWLRMADGSNLAKTEVPEADLPEVKLPEIPEMDDFDSPTLGRWYYAPRNMPESFADVTSRPGHLRIRGQEALTSLNRVSLIARKLTGVYGCASTKMDFKPEVYQHYAGLVLYYDNMDYIMLRKYYSQTLGQSAIGIISLENGGKTEWMDTRTAVDDCPICMKIELSGRKFHFYWGYDEDHMQQIGGDFDTAKLSDEYCKAGEFTGTHVGLFCCDQMFHRKTADFDYFKYVFDEEKEVL